MKLQTCQSTEENGWDQVFNISLNTTTNSIQAGSASEIYFPHQHNHSKILLKSFGL